MNETRKGAVRWLETPEAHDYPAAQSYLTLLFEDDEARRLVQKLRDAPVAQYKAKDIFRASGLSQLGISNLHVEKDRKKIRAGTALSPLLLVRSRTERLIVADGYHRLCAVYAVDEDAMIPCQLI